MSACTLNTSNTTEFVTAKFNTHHCIPIIIEIRRLYPLLTTCRPLPNHSGDSHRQTESNVIPCFHPRFPPSVPLRNRIRLYTAIFATFIYWGIVGMVLTIHTIVPSHRYCYCSHPGMVSMGTYSVIDIVLCFTEFDTGTHFTCLRSGSAVFRNQLKR